MAIGHFARKHAVEELNQEVVHATTLHLIVGDKDVQDLLLSIVAVTQGVAQVSETMNVQGHLLKLKSVTKGHT